MNNVSHLNEILTPYLDLKTTFDVKHSVWASEVFFKIKIIIFLDNLILKIFF